LGFVITASARRLRVAIRCCPSMITHARARRLHGQRAQVVPSEYRHITRPLPPPAAPTLSSTPRQRRSRGKSHGLRSYGIPGSYTYGLPLARFRSYTVISRAVISRASDEYPKCGAARARRRKEEQWSGSASQGM
jgi:hypothetical protein